MLLSTISAQKRALRKSMTALLCSMDPLNVKDQSRAIAAKVLSLPAFQTCTNVSCFISMPSGEVDTSAIIAEILASSNKSLFVPKISADDGAMELLQVHNQHDLDGFPSGLWGIREPTDEWQGKARLKAMDTGLNLILVPGVAFDRSMSRLGHGKGYYDRYIARYIASGRPCPLLVALALRDQLVDSTVPVNEHDYKIDIIVTPDEVVTKS